MASNYGATSLSAGLNTFLHLENANGNTWRATCEPSIDTLSTYCAASAATVALCEVCVKATVRDGGVVCDLVSQLASIGLELSID